MSNLASTKRDATAVATATSRLSHHGERSSTANREFSCIFTAWGPRRKRGSAPFIQWCRILERNSCARSERWVPKNSSLVQSSMILPASMKITRWATLREAHLVRDHHHGHAFLRQ